MWEYNTKMILREICSEAVNCLHLVHVKDQLRAFVDTIMNFMLPYMIENLLRTRETVAFWRSALANLIKMNTYIIAWKCVSLLLIVKAAFAAFNGNGLHRKPFLVRIVRGSVHQTRVVYRKGAVPLVSVVKWLPCLLPVGIRLDEIPARNRGLPQ